MKKRRRRYTFTYHFSGLCHPHEVKRMHDKIHKVTAQAIADLLGESIELDDCKTGKVKGSVRPRR